MPIGIIANNWYNEDELAHDLDIPVEQARAMIARIKADGRFPIAYHTHDYTKPEVSGYAVKHLLGQQI